MGVAHAKLLLFGEHAVVQGYPALGLGLPLTLRVDYLSEAAQWAIVGLPPQFQNQVLGALHRLVDEFPPECPAGVLQIQSDIPPASGLGSSAALCSALVSLFYPKLSHEEHWQRAVFAEHYFHGKSSGVDVALAMREGLWYFEPGGNQPRIVEAACPPLYLVVGSLQRSTEARDLIMGIHRRYHENEGGVSRRISFLGQCAQRARSMLSKSPPQLKQLGLLAMEAQGVLQELGLGHPTWECLSDVAMSTGSLGGKWSGAGGGGAFWFLYDDADRAQQAARTLIKAIEEDWLLEPRALILGYRTK